MRIKSKDPNYPFTMVTLPYDPCKVQAEMPGTDFVSVGVLNTDRPTMRLWCFRFQSDLRKFSELLELKHELLQVDVSPS